MYIYNELLLNIDTKYASNMQKLNGLSAVENYCHVVPFSDLNMVSLAT